MPVPVPAPTPAPDLDTLALRVLLGAFPGTTLPDDYRALLSDGLGGVCWFGSNTADGSEALARLGGQVRSVSPRAVIAVDEEGGDVTRLHATGLSPVPGAAVLGAVDDVVLTRDVARTIGTALVAAGVNLDLGPVADVNTNADNPVIGTRSFGADPAQVAVHVAAWVSGLQEAGVAACVKHFPGHGDTAEDSHLALPRLDVEVETLARRELVPFVAAVSAGAASVMTSHIVVPALDPDLPATMSAAVLTVLRDIGFEGVIVSDALDMAGASSDRGIPEAAVLALAGGVDLLCLGSAPPAAEVREVQAAILAAVADGRLSVERLVEAVTRVDRMLDRLAPATSYDVAAERLTAAASQALLVEGALPDLTGACVLSVATPANIAVGDVPWGLSPDRSVEATTPDLPGDGPLVVQVRDAHRRPDVISFLGRVEASGRPAVVIEWGWPGPYAGGLPRICTRGVSGPGVRAVTGVLRHKGWTEKGWTQKGWIEKGWTP